MRVVTHTLQREAATIEREAHLGELLREPVRGGTWQSIRSAVPPRLTRETRQCITQRRSPPRLLLLLSLKLRLKLRSHVRLGLGLSLRLSLRLNLRIRVRAGPGPTAEGECGQRLLLSVA